MIQKQTQISGKQGKKQTNLSNVKKRRKYERFGEHIRYFTMDEWKLFISSIDNHEHNLMMLLIYETGCIVGEFVKINLNQTPTNQFYHKRTIK